MPLEPHARVAITAEFEITAGPGSHSVPVMGLHIRDLRGGGTMAYGADGEPSAGVLALAQGVDLLVHEATGAHPGHSTAEGAARLAREAAARRLVLVRLAPQNYDLEAERIAAAKLFGGQLSIGQDLERYEF